MGFVRERGENCSPNLQYLRKVDFSRKVTHSNQVKDYSICSRILLFRSTFHQLSGSLKVAQDKQFFEDIPLQKIKINLLYIVKNILFKLFDALLRPVQAYACPALDTLLKLLLLFGATVDATLQVLFSTTINAFNKWSQTRWTVWCDMPVEQKILELSWCTSTQPVKTTLGADQSIPLRRPSQMRS